MRLAVLPEPSRFELIDEPEPKIAPDEVLLRVAACGVCTSELDMYRGLAGHATYPWYPGHEVSGVVERIGEDVETRAVGDRVAAWVTTRGYGELVAARAEHCFPAGDLPLEVALGEPLACAVNAVELADPALGDDVVVIGAGFMGNLVQKLVALRGPRRVIVADTRTDALERASALGATRTVDVTREDLPAIVREMTDGRGADVSFEATGIQAGLDALGAVTRMSGTVAIVGYHQGAPRTIDLAHWNWMAFRVANAHFREVATILRGMRTGMRLLTSGRIRLDDLVTHRFRLDAIDEAFHAAIDKPPGFVKATVIP
ncbi:MAG: alcohol dehydrogenase catalytic domain-containing protein [Actinomycetota bacterium]|jgi:L-iditol 2-dehydrogenase